MIKAVIFDMDGLMIDATSTYVDAETRLLKQFNKEYSHEIRKKYMGKRISGMLETMIQEYDLPITQEEAEKTLRKYVRENFYRSSVTLLPGCGRLVNSLTESKNYVMAVASSSPKEIIEIVIERFGFKDVFEVLVSSEEVKNGKPAPDVFLYCAELLHISPASCLVLEDGPLGIVAAKRAGMKTIAVYNKKINKPEDFSNMPDRIFSSLEEVTLDVVTSL